MGCCQARGKSKVIADIANKSEYSIETKKVKKIIFFIMKSLGLKQNQEVAVTFLDEQEMAQLHEKWMQESGPTDVMSFRLSEISDFDYSLGDIVICPKVAERDAKKLKKQPALHLAFLLAHGMLHLIGFDHQKKEEKVKMQEQEQSLMSKIMREFA
jgi:probable rRNA maturation factor